MQPDSHCVTASGLRPSAPYRCEAYARCSSASLRESSCSSPMSSGLLLAGMPLFLKTKRIASTPPLTSPAPYNARALSAEESSRCTLSPMALKSASARSASSAAPP
eukprot:4803691-Prymnesium_polylepis.1